ncbi:MAG: DUF1926 domain-containing protein [Spirochaetaceae bacterium]|nr:DUF1926 domain-containing protein [Spirochaetaceae bacterium]
MESVSLCFQISDYVNCSQKNAVSEGIKLDAFFEQQYQDYYRQIAQFLYSETFFNFSFSFTGLQIEWLAKKHKEFILLISTMTNRKQIEVLGGAYNNPLLPTLLSVDRVGQIEAMTTLIRQQFGKKPKGMQLPSNARDSSLVSNLKNCVMDFIFVDRNLIPAEKDDFLPYIVQDSGKNLCILAEHQNLQPDVSISPYEYLAKLKKLVERKCKDVLKPVICCSISPGQLCELISSGWLLELKNAMLQPSNIPFFWDLPTKYVKSVQHFQRVYIPSGIYLPDMKKPCNLYDYLLRQPNVYMLYSKMMYLSLLLSQSRCDKASKQAVRELLWQGQDARAFSDKDFFEEKNEHNFNAFHCFIEAEKILRKNTDFFDSVTSFDYDSDGCREYICQFGNFNLYIQARGGSVFEFDVLKNAYNYAANSLGHTGLFLDYLGDKNFTDKTDVFTRQIYKEISFNSKCREIKLQASGKIGNLQQSVLLKKNYYVNAHGVQVQYIIKNDSESDLIKTFSVESNMFVQMNETEGLRVEIISGDKKELQIVNLISFQDPIRDVSLVRFFDGEVTFVFELNENANIKFFTVSGRLTLVLSWDIEVLPQREIEKTVSLSVIPKNARQKNKKK